MPDGRDPQQRHRRVPRRDRRRRRRARAVPHRGAARCGRCLRLLRRGRHRGRRAARQGRRRPRSRAGSSGWPRSPRSSIAQRAEDRIGETVDGPGRVGRATTASKVVPSTRRRRSTARSRLPTALQAVAIGSTVVHAASSSACDGVDLVARAMSELGTAAAWPRLHPPQPKPDQMGDPVSGAPIVNIANALTLRPAAARPGLRGASWSPTAATRRAGGTGRSSRSRRPASPMSSTVISPAVATWSPMSGRSPTRSPTRR